MPSLGYYAHKSKKNNKKLQRWQENPLNGEVNAIRGEVPNESLANLFAQTVEGLVGKLDNKKNPERTSNLDEIRDIVSRVKAKVLEVDEADESYSTYSEILQEGLKDLKTLIKDPKKLSKLKKAEVIADQQDRRRYESVEQQAAILPSSNPNIKIQMYFMENPDKEPYLLEQGHLITTYNDIMWHLNFHEVVQAPELWARREDPEVQPYTESGRHWIFVVGRETISETVLDIVDMTSRADCYIVALVQTEERELPVSIDLPIFGKQTCCDSSCGSLWKHLESIWKDVRVECARLFIDKNCVRDKPLDSKNFGVRKNELYVKVIPRCMEEGPSATTMEASA